MRKFIVTSEGKLKFGDVALHKHLLEKGEDCIGGGVYEFDYVNNRMLLSGRSYDFGRVKWQWIDTLRVAPSIAGLDIYYEDLPLSHFVQIIGE